MLNEFVQVDRDRPEPLFRQIETSLAYAIVTGKLRSGSRLPSLRSAAETWSVNLHTVRRAYAELTRRGLVITAGRGSVVAQLKRNPTPDTEFDAWVSRAVREAQERFGATPRRLVRAFERHVRRSEKKRRSVSFAECSEVLSTMLATDVRDRVGVEITPVDFNSVDDLPEGTIVGTYFHQEQLVQRLDGRLNDLHLVRIRPGLPFLTELARSSGAGGIRRVVLIDRQSRSAEDLSGDLRPFLGDDVLIELRTPDDPAASFPDPEPKQLVIVTPKSWELLPERLRDRVDVQPLAYEVEPDDLEALSRALGWRSLDAVSRV